VVVGACTTGACTTGACVCVEVLPDDADADGELATPLVLPSSPLVAPLVVVCCVVCVDVLAVAWVVPWCAITAATTTTPATPTAAKPAVALLAARSPSDLVVISPSSPLVDPTLGGHPDGALSVV
jgi:hypothetical protein